MSEIEVMPFTLSAAREYGRLRAALQAEGLTLAAHDMLIVAHAIELDATLVTADTDFKSANRYAKISNWR
jgi:tRNA(fMet)-specific endonuclease VapC